jgi:hypothetical protein
MTGPQKAAILLGAVLFAVSGLLVPYDGVLERPTERGMIHAKRPLGYFPLFQPPSPDQVASAIHEHPFEPSGILRSYYRAEIRLPQVLIQMTLIAVITLAAVALLARRRDQSR